MKKPVALFDLDNTLADFNGAMLRDLAAIRNPAEAPIASYGDDDNLDPAWLRARKTLIKRSPNWWLNLAPIPSGMELYNLAREIGYRIVICSRGPRRNASAWAQKIEWCGEHVPDARVILADDKSLVYGRVLVDDWPDYVEPWLKKRPRGAVIMPHQTWNEKYRHARCLRYTGANMLEAESVLLSQFQRKVLQ